jgi:ABC-type glutathione transport system ATPase component
VSPSKRQRLAADAQQADQRQILTSSQFRDAAVGFLSSRVVDSQGPQAATLQLRPSLQKVHDDLVAVLDNAVQLKQNASLLVIGEPGIGKTMVSSTTCSMASNTTAEAVSSLYAASGRCLCTSHGRAQQQYGVALSEQQNLTALAPRWTLRQPVRTRHALHALQHAAALNGPVASQSHA